MSKRAAVFGLASILLLVGCGDENGGLGGAGKGLAGGDLEREPTPEPEPTTTAAPTTTTAPATTSPPSTVHSGPPGAFAFPGPGIINCTFGRPTNCQLSPFGGAVSVPFVLGWNAAPGATAYSLELVAANGVDKRPLGPVPSRSFRIESQHLGSCRNPCSWTYVVTATNAAGISQTRLNGLKV